MSKAKPTHMRPILEAAIASGELTFSTRKASRWALVTIDDLTARLAAAEAFVAKHKCGSCGGVRVTEAELCSCDEAANGWRE